MGKMADEGFTATETNVRDDKVHLIFMSGASGTLWKMKGSRAEWTTEQWCEARLAMQTSPATFV